MPSPLREPCDAPAFIEGLRASYVRMRPLECHPDRQYRPPRHPHEAQRSPPDAAIRFRLPVSLDGYKNRGGSPCVQSLLMERVSGRLCGFEG